MAIKDITSEVGRLRTVEKYADGYLRAVHEYGIRSETAYRAYGDLTEAMRVQINQETPT